MLDACAAPEGLLPPVAWGWLAAAALPGQHCGARMNGFLPGAGTRASQYGELAPLPIHLIEEDPALLAFRPGFYVFSCPDDISVYFLCHFHFMELGGGCLPNSGTQRLISGLSACAAGATSDCLALTVHSPYTGLESTPHHISSICGGGVRGIWEPRC